MDNLSKAKASKTFCILPWVSQYIDPSGDVTPCCVYKRTSNKLGSLKENTLEEIWNSEETKKIRLQMLDGEILPGCDACNIRNDIDMQVFKDDITEKFWNTDKHIVELTETDGSVPVHNIRYLDARFNNLCNFKCRTCGVRYSSSWFIDDAIDRKRKNEVIDINAKALIYPGTTETQLYDEILPHIENLQQIYFAGGEPLMQVDHYRVLEKLIEIGHTGTIEKPLEINYNTNFSQLSLGNHNALELWKNFNNIKINASIDGSHKRAEYWRKGTVWNTIIENRKKMIEQCPNTKFVISYTLSWVTAFNLVELHKEWTELGLIESQNFTINLLDGPIEYNLKYIPHWKKQKIEKLFLDQIDWLEKLGPKNKNTIDWYQGAINFMYSVNTDNDTYEYGKRFVHLVTNMDEIRKENFWDVYPEHQDMKEFLGV